MNRISPYVDPVENHEAVTNVLVSAGTPNA